MPVHICLPSGEALFGLWFAEIPAEFSPTTRADRWIGAVHWNPEIARWELVCGPLDPDTGQWSKRDMFSSYSLNEVANEAEQSRAGVVRHFKGTLSGSVVVCGSAKDWRECLEARPVMGLPPWLHMVIVERAVAATLPPHQQHQPPGRRS